MCRELERVITIQKESGTTESNDDVLKDGDKHLLRVLKKLDVCRDLLCIGRIGQQLHH